LVVVAVVAVAVQYLVQTQMVLLDGTLVVVAEEHSVVVAEELAELERLHMVTIGMLVMETLVHQEKHQEAVAVAVAVLENHLITLVEVTQHLVAQVATEQQGR
jgi:hypothetical protein